LRASGARRGDLGLGRKLLRLIAAFALLGLALSTYSLLHHESFVSGSLCTFNATFNCDIVNRGPYSEIAGVPVALMGLIGYGFMLVAACLRMRRPADESLLNFLVLVSAGALAFSLYLTGVEAFVLKAWCVVCITSQISILTIFASSCALRLRSVGKEKQV
jgi:uncharacterized membrane protein